MTIKSCKCIALSAALLLISCYSYNRPLLSPTNSLNSFNITKIFVDMNGDYYPNTYKKDLPTSKIKSSLFLAYSNEKKLQVLDDYRDSLLNQFKKKLKNKSRVYILVHGFNNTEIEAKESYYNLVQKINIDQEKDEIVEFYWEGLIGGGIGSGKIWFNAAGYSQMSGIFGLRPLLNQINNKEVFIISHSRGASVVLSAISNPPWNKKFESDTEEILEDRFIVKENLKANRNSIKCIMLAPAIGNIDFFKLVYNNNNINQLGNYRLLDSQLVNIWITTNTNDIVLKKGVKFLSGKFNPSNIGFNGDGLNFLNEVYGKDFIIQLDFSSRNNSHDFLSYIENPKLISLFKGSGIPVK